MSDKDKIEVLNECINRTYYNLELSPILNDIYDMVDYEIKKFFLGADLNKTSYYDKLFPFFKYIVKEGNIELFHDIVNKIIHPNCCRISSRLVIDLYKLAVEPYVYCSKDNNESHFSLIVNYFCDEEATDFCFTHSNYLYYYCMGRLIEYRSKNNLSWNFAQNVIYYLFYHNISDEKAKKSYDFFIDNGETFDSYFALNYNKDNIIEFMDMLMNKIFQEMELNKREIK